MSNKSVVCLVGRPNVGKSTIFNALTKTRNALVLDLPGTTRDRQYGEALLDEREIILIDTGGLSEDDDGVEVHMNEQVALAIEESDVIVFVLDAKAGLTPYDQDIAQHLRIHKKPIVLVANKIDGVNPDTAILDFYEVGMGEPLPLTASHRKGINTLREHVLDKLPEEPEEVVDDSVGAKIAIIGRPNVGKSTLTNRLLGDDRVVVYDMPGTTRDSIYVKLEHHGKPYTFIDTAGVRRKSRVDEVIEKFSIVKTLSAIEDSHVALILVDGSEGLTEQDLHLIGFALHVGRGVVIAINKWDHLSDDQRESVKKSVDRKLVFVENFVDVHYISAKHGTAVGNLYASIDQAYESGQKQISTADVNRVLEIAVRDNSPPMKNSRRIKLRYAHVGGHNPLKIVIHGNQLEKLPENYQRYLMQVYRKAFKLRGVPIHIQLIKSENPFSKK